MEYPKLDFLGGKVSSGELSVRKAKDITAALQTDKINFVKLVGCFKHTANEIETVVVDMEVERGQRTVYDIRFEERIGIMFSMDESKAPEVISLRPDFPQTPHQLISNYDFPKSLCLFEETNDELVLNWTPTMLLRQISQWLALTAEGRLHGEDQPLEQLLPAASSRIILPYDLIHSVEEGITSVFPIRIVDSGPELTFIADEVGRKNGALSFTAIMFSGKPQIHGIIHRNPRNIFELHNFMLNAGINVLKELRDRFKNWSIEGKATEMQGARLIILLRLPKTREEGQAEESVEMRGFITASTLGEIGMDIGAWQIIDGKQAYIWGYDDNMKGYSTVLSALNINYSLTRDYAAVLNGLPSKVDKKIVLIGAGALGSQVYMNLSRVGFGIWAVIDNDIVLSHNLAKHVLLGETIGYKKAIAIVGYTNNTILGNPQTKAITADVLHPLDKEEELRKEYKEADVILDISASVAVARYISNNVDSNARRISMFLNPEGDAVVILAEDSERKYPLDFLEMQYYRYLINNKEFYGHLESSDEGRIRYAHSCRDVSNRIPNDHMVLHGALCSKALKGLVSKDSASITICIIDGLDVKRHVVIPQEITKYKIGEWVVCYDALLLKQVYSWRKERLPNETGGVLIGSFDMHRQIVYIVDMIKSPTDSIEWPTVYIRGCKGLKDKVESISKITAGNLVYVGEWHSHPDWYGCQPSNDDYKAFLDLSDEMFIDGYPAVMMIVGSNEYSLHIGTMIRK